MRTFIAIELPQEIKDYLSRVQNHLKSSGAEVKWVEPANIHLTLKFLGEIEPDLSDKVKRTLENATANKKIFPLRLGTIGAFPKINFPRVIWVGIDKGDDEVKEVAEKLEEDLTKLGFPKEDRPFSSHITIGRLKSNQNREKLISNLQTLSNNSIQEKLEFTVSKITLFKSTLTPKGPIYEALHYANLKTK